MSLRRGDRAVGRQGGREGENREGMAEMSCVGRQAGRDTVKRAGGGEGGRRRAKRKPKAVTKPDTALSVAPLCCGLLRGSVRVEAP